MSYRILLVEDNPGDALLVEESFAEAAGLGTFSTRHVQRLSSALTALTSERFDAVLLDLGLPDSNGLETLTLVSAAVAGTPIIVLTGDGDEVLGLKSLNHGAHDYLVKGKVFGTMLARAVIYAIQRHRTEQTLRAAEAQHRLLFETMAQGAIYYDADGRIVAANSQALDYFGATLDQLNTDGPGYAISREDGSPLYPEDHPAAIARLTGCEKNGLIIRVDANGRHRWLMVHARPYFNPGESRPNHIFATFTDVTAIRQAEEALRVSEERFRTLTEYSYDLTFVVSALGVITYCSPSVASVLGYNADMVVGSSLLDLCHPDDLEGAARTAEALVNTPSTSRTHVWRAAHRDGSWRYLETIVRNLIDHPAVNGFVANVQDVTDRRETELSLRSVHERLAAVVDTSPLAIVSVDREHRVQLWNRAAERIFGWAAQEIVGRPYPLQAPPESMDPGSEFTAAFRGRVVEGVELRRLTKAGAVVDVGLWNAQLRDQEGEVAGVVGMMADITQQKLLEESLRQSQKMEAVGRLAGGIAHDFNNILTALSGHAGLLLDQVPTESPLRGDLLEIESGVVRASNLTRQLLTFSRKQVVQPRVVDLVVLTNDMQKMLQRILGEDIALSVDAASEYVCVEADPGQLEQVILNLAVNARDAMPRGGRLTITLQSATGGMNGSSTAGAHAVMKVADTGCGMTSAVRAKIFEPFFTTKPQGKGTGLGLPTVYGIVQQAGGAIELETSPGLGSTFTVRLPLSALRPVAEEAAVRQSKTGSGVILLVEDEPSVRHLMDRVLSRRGFTVLTAGGGREAASIADTIGQVDLLITDVVMPDMSGREVATMLREKWPTLEVLFMSGYTEEEISSRGVLHQGINFLEKPFSPDQVIAKVSELISVAG